MKFLTSILIFAIALTAIDAKIYTKCEFAKKMKSAGIPVSLLPDWVCLAMSESSMNSSVRGPKNSNGSYDYGIFQINDKYWCSVSGPGKDCNIKCSNLLNDDISDDITCAKKIYARHGFNAWYGWINKCKGKSLAAYSVSGCGL